MIFAGIAGMIMIIILLLTVSHAHAIARTGEMNPTGTGRTGEQNPPAPVTFTLQNPLKVNSIGGLVKNFVEIFSYLAVIFAVLVLIYVGFSFVMARGKPEETKRLKLWLGWTVVGIAVIIGARLMIDVVINTLSATGTISPNVIRSARDANSGN